MDRVADDAVRQGELDAVVWERWRDVREFVDRFSDSWLTAARLGKTDGTEIQHVEIIRLCGRSPPETRSYVLNKAVRRCVTSCGIKGCGVRYRSRVHGPFVRRFAFTQFRRQRPDATIQKPAKRLRLPNESPSRRGQPDRASTMKQGVPSCRTIDSGSPSRFNRWVQFFIPVYLFLISNFSNESNGDSTLW